MVLFLRFFSSLIYFLRCLLKWFCDSYTPLIFASFIFSLSFSYFTTVHSVNYLTKQHTHNWFGALIYINFKVTKLSLCCWTIWLISLWCYTSHWHRAVRMNGFSLDEYKIIKLYWRAICKVDRRRENEDASNSFL